MKRDMDLVRSILIQLEDAPFKLTAKAGLSGLRFHDLRHNAITELLTNPNVSVQTTKSIAGHVSQRMVDRYAHIRLEAKRSALDALTQHPITLVTVGTSNQPADQVSSLGDVSSPGAIA